MPNSRSWIPVRLAWHLFIVTAVLTLPPAVVFLRPFWSLPGINTQITLGLLSAYLIGLAAQGLWGRGLARPQQRTVALVAGGAVLALLYLGILLIGDATYSRLLLLAGTMVVVVGITGAFVNVSRHQPAIATALLLVSSVMLAFDFVHFSDQPSFGTGYLAMRLLESPQTQRPSQRTELLRTNRQLLDLTFYSGYLSATTGPLVHGGAIRPIPNTRAYLLADGRGHLYRLRWDDTSTLIVEPLDLHVPINNAEFEADVPGNVPTSEFRVADILAVEAGDSMLLYASHHYWKHLERCFVVRVSVHQFDTEDDAQEQDAGGWRTIYESRPCLPLKQGRGATFAGLQIGGQLAVLDPGHLLLTVGDHQFDGWFGSPNYVEDMSADYGKTVTIDVESGTVQHFTFGHRNPQGLVIDPAGHIWATEHGPQGGDELNLLIPGQDYGWPRHTYGVDYGGVTWPPGDRSDGGDADSVRPVFAWVPSIGISGIAAVDDSVFGRWTGDLLIGALADRSLWRVRIEDERVVYAERIPIGVRVRGVTAAGRGEILLWTDQATIVRITPNRIIDKGNALYTLNCRGCHHDAQNRIGPALHRIVGQPVATVAGYDYSPALRQFGGWWTEDRLDAFLTEPGALVPGTTMRLDGNLDSDERSAIIGYMKAQGH